jgi:hypothetical protein
MDRELLKEISKAVLNEALLRNWVFYALLLFFAILSAWFSNFIGAYSRKRGEDLATKADLEGIKKQLASTTEVTERIRKEIEHETWRKQQQESVRRSKLEDYLCYVYVAQENLSTEMFNKYFYENIAIGDTYAINKANMLKMLYFPELEPEHEQLCAQWAAFKNWVSQGMKEQLEKRRAGDQKPVVSEEHLSKYSERLAAVNDAVTAVEHKAAVIAQKLNAA